MVSGWPTAVGGRHGFVHSFDTDAGLGEVADADGNRWLFHCTTIADGTRTIEVGTEVRFDVAPGGPGRWEAFAVSPQA